MYFILSLLLNPYDLGKIHSLQTGISPPKNEELERFKIPKSRSYLIPIQSECLGAGTRQQYFLKHSPGGSNVRQSLGTTRVVSRNVCSCLLCFLEYSKRAGLE